MGEQLDVNHLQQREDGPLVPHRALGLQLRDEVLVRQFTPGRAVKGDDGAPKSRQWIPTKAGMTGWLPVGIFTRPLKQSGVTSVRQKQREL